MKHKAPLPCQTQQMHAGVVQLTGIHPVEVGGILKIRLHIAIIFSLYLLFPLFITTVLSTTVSKV